MEIIMIKDKISSYPVSRSAADQLFQDINNSDIDDIIINFENVTGITHSFASQYRFDKNKCRKNITEINTNGNIVKMFKTLDHKKIANTAPIEIKRVEF